MVDKYCWLGPGGNKYFDSKIMGWKNSKLSKRTIIVLKFIKEHSPIDIGNYEDNIIEYLIQNEVGSEGLNKKHTYGPLLFVNFISKKENELKITEEGISFLNYIDDENFEKATEIYLDQLFNANFETDATKKIEIKAFPVQIMFKMLYDNEIIPLFMFQTHIQYIKNISDLKNCLSLSNDGCFFEYMKDLKKFHDEDGDKFKSIYRLAKDRWKSYVIGTLVSLEIFDKDSYDEGYLKFTEFGKSYVERKNIANVSYESMFY